MIWKFKRTAFIWNRNILQHYKKLFTFDQFTASLLNISILLFKRKNGPQTVERYYANILNILKLVNIKKIKYKKY